MPKIVEIIKKEEPKLVLDLFSGTGRVGHALQNEGITVIANDHNEYAHFLASVHVAMDPKSPYSTNFQAWIDELNAIKGVPGWVTKNYCIKSRYFHPKNGAKIDAIREYIEANFRPKDESNASWKVWEPYRFLIIALIEAADRVDSTCGLQMAYLKELAPRAHNDLVLRIPNLSKGRGVAIRDEAKNVAELPVDLVYIDPPYNQHSYLGNYHIWESICLWDKPETYGKANKRIDVKTRKSDFNSKKRIKSAFSEIIGKIIAPKALISFNNEGYLSQEDILEILSQNFDTIEVIEVPYRRYIGSQIGIHNKKGEKVGKISHTKNKELLFLAKRAK
jgi:adenine-specific DNA-methyltransferase